jgi:GT2 family glycosyltransferase
MRLAHIIVAYNSPEEIERLIIEIGKQAEANHLIILVDNSEWSFCRTNKNLCEKYNGIDNYSIEYYPLSENFGSAKGFAIGMTLGFQKGADYVWLHDQDGYPYDTCLNILKTYFNSDFDLIGPRIFYENGKSLHVFNGIYDNRTMQLKPIIFDNEIEDADVAGTAGLCISRRVFDKIGTYDFIHYFIGNEDFDYCLKAKKNGFKLGIVKEAKYFHPNKWGNIDLLKKSPNRPFQYFGELYCNNRAKSRDFSGINFIIKHLGSNFFLSLVYSTITLIFHKIRISEIKLFLTITCYLLAMSNRFSKKYNKLLIRPENYISKE